MNDENQILYGMGIVVNDKIEDDLYVKVYPISKIPTATGELSKEEEVATASMDMLGGNINVIINKSHTIDCKWVNQGDSNRLSAPDVCKGEIVYIYNYNGQDNYWWDTVFTKPEYRKREKAFYFFSNKGEIDSSSSFLEKGYFLLVDTINKLTHFHTASNDGKLTTYDISIDTKKGSLLISDGRNNSLELVSHKDGLIINTNATVEVNTKKATVNASESVNVNTSQCTIKSDFCSINP